MQVPFEKAVLPSQFKQVGHDADHQGCEDEGDHDHGQLRVVKQAPSHGVQAVHRKVEKKQNWGDEQVKQTDEQDHDDTVDELSEYVVYGIGNQVPSPSLTFHQTDIWAVFEMRCVSLYLNGFFTVNIGAFDEPAVFLPECKSRRSFRSGHHGFLSRGIIADFMLLFGYGQCLRVPTCRLKRWVANTMLLVEGFHLATS